MADNSWNIALLRYFNPIGAHKSGLIGEDPSEVHNLVPYISQVAIGKLDLLKVFGGDYNTHDGTGVRDYIHVVDLAKGHVAALRKLLPEDKGSVLTVNLGTGNGYSVLDMVAAFAEASGAKIEWKFVDRRPGDIDQCYADPHLAAAELGWRARRSLKEMCADTWRWQSQNPDGYMSES